MAVAPQGLCLFPGVQSVIAASYTLSHGISPGVCTMEIAPQNRVIPRSGPLEFRFAGIRLVFPDCLIDQASFRTGPTGQIVSLRIFDRRWKWGFGKISGQYNVRDERGDLDGSTLLDPLRLCALCLEAMGEKGYDVSEVPVGSAWPEVAWEYANPAQALAQLCDQLGCRVVLQLNGRVAIRRLGGGRPLPNDLSVMEGSTDYDPPERPRAIEVVCGKTRYQADLRLEAVGEDVNGEILPINELSYKPAGGWGPEGLGVFGGITAGDHAVNLAKATVYRWYRIIEQNNQAGTRFIVPGYPKKVKYRKQLLPVEDVLVQSVEKRDGSVQFRKAEVRGTFWTGGFDYVNSDAGTRYTGDFSIDRERGIVQFNEYVTQTVSVGSQGYQFHACDDLVLRCAVSVRDELTRAWDRAGKLLVYPSGAATGPRMLLHDEIVLNVWPTYRNNVPVSSVNSLNDNREDVLAECDYYLAAADREYRIPGSYELAYAGLKPINPDGAIQQVTWAVGTQGATTRASWNNEFSLRVPPYKERRMIERLRDSAMTTAIVQAGKARAKKE